jgi:hypothetical protein
MNNKMRGNTISLSFINTGQPRKIIIKFIYNKRGILMVKNSDTIPIEVIILTADHDIKGTVHVSKYTDTNRELTDLLNDRERRFLAVTNVEIYPKNSNQPPKRYDFLEIHMDYVLMVHPTSQALFRENSKSNEDILRFRELRAKLSQTKPF